MSNVNVYIVLSVKCKRCGSINELWSDYTDTPGINDLENALYDDSKNGGWTTPNEDDWLCPLCTNHLINLESILE